MKTHTLTLICLLALGAGCEAEDMHELMRDVGPGKVGGPLMPIPPAAVAAIAPRGRGGGVTLQQFAPPVTTDNGAHLTRPAEMITASIFAAGGPGSGPLVGVAKWGSGNGVQQQIEFDVQIGFPEPAVIANTFGGAILSVPCTSLELVVRNDANLLPRAGDQPLGSTVNTPSATASLALGTRASTAALTRTIYAVNLPAGGFAAAATVDVGVPAFAQRFRMFRSSANNAVQVTFLSTAGVFAPSSGPYTDLANVAPALYTIPANTSFLRLTNAGPGVLDVLGVVFELGL